MGRGPQKQHQRKRNGDDLRRGVDRGGPGEYRKSLIDTLNARGADYAEFDFPGGAPSYAALRYLGDKMAEAMAGTDSKWVIEQVIEIEAPEAVKTIRRLVHEVLGIRLD